MSERPVQLLIADDHPLIRSGMRAQLEPLGGAHRFSVHEASDAASLRAALAQAQSRSLPIELALVDVMMPGMQGAASVLALAQGFPQVAFLVVTGLPMAALQSQLRSQPNIRGILDKSHSAAELRRAVDLALSGIPIWPAADSMPSGLDSIPEFIASHVDSVRASGHFSSQNSISGTLQDLSPRQRDVAQAVARGLTNAQIAAELGLTEGTVKAYLKEIFRNLGISNRTQLALRLGA